MIRRELKAWVIIISGLCQGKTLSGIARDENMVVTNLRRAIR